MQLYVTFKISSNFRFPNLTIASNIFQPIFLETLSYINDSVVVSQKQKSNQNKQKDAPSLCEVFWSKNKS